MDFFNFIEKQTKWYQNKADALLDARCEMRMQILSCKQSTARHCIDLLACSAQEAINAIKRFAEVMASGYMI